MSKYVRVSLNRAQLMAVRQRLYADYHAAMTSGDVRRANEPVCFAFTKIADAIGKLDDMEDDAPMTDAEFLSRAISPPHTIPTISYPV